MIGQVILNHSKGRYFGSTTRNLNMAILSELNDRGANWTKRFKPVKLVRVVPVKNDEEYEQLHLQELKRAFLENHYLLVRGGAFNQIHEEYYKRMVYKAIGIAFK